MGRCVEWGTTRISFRTTFLRIIINELPSKIDNVSKLFAVDSEIISVIKRVMVHYSFYDRCPLLMDIDKLQNDLFTVGEWCKTWGMRLNVEKCKVMHFGKSNPKQPIA